MKWIEKSSSSVLALVIVFLCLAIYIPALWAGFLWDDNTLVTENFLLRSAEGLRGIWTAPKLSPQGYYWPLLYSFLWIQYHLWGLQSWGYHAINILLHIVNALLVWRLLARIRLPGAWFAAALFAVHPIQVESVAWVAEQKNMLSTLFYLLAFLSYLRFDEQGNRRAYGASLALFLCAGLVKTMTLSLPAALLLCLWARHARVRLAHLAALLPFFLMAVVLGAMQLLVYSGGGGLAKHLSMGTRLILAGRCLWFYLGKLMAPVNLMAIYPLWQVDAGSVWQYGFPLLAVALPVALWFMKDRIGKWPCAAVCFYGVSLLPMLHLVAQKGFTSFAYVNDHAQYLASIGMLALFAGFVRGGVMQIEAHKRKARLVVPVVLFVLTIIASLHVQQFRTMETLFTHALVRNSRAWPAHVNMATVFLKRGALDAAKEHFDTALDIHADCSEAHAGLGIIAVRKGDLDGAVSAFEKACLLSPKNTSAWANLGLARFQAGDIEGSMSALDRAIEINPFHANAIFLRGNVLMSTGHEDEALACYTRAIEIDASHAGARYNLGFLLLKRGRLAEAEDALRKVIELQAGNARAHYDMGIVLIVQGRHDEAIPTLQRAVQLAEEQHANDLAIESRELLQEAQAGGRKARTNNATSAP